MIEQESSQKIVVFECRPTWPMLWPVARTLSIVPSVPVLMLHI
jgi:hypothetical protein